MNNEACRYRFFRNLKKGAFARGLYMCNLTQPLLKRCSLVQNAHPFSFVLYSKGTRCSKGL